MYDIQWFKVEKNIFYNRKIQLLLGFKDGDRITKQDIIGRF